jgi:small subunit ribosomal protein S6e
MVEFKGVINDPKGKKSFQVTVSGHHANSLIGKQIGDEFDGIFVGLPGYKLKIMGGSDKDGYPMRRDLKGPRRMKILTSEGHGFHPLHAGAKDRKNMRGNQISAEIMQINMKITHYGSKNIADLVGGKDKEEKK